MAETRYPPPPGSPERLIPTDTNPTSLTDSSAVDDAMSESPTSTAGSFKQRRESTSTNATSPSPLVQTTSKPPSVPEKSSRRRKSSAASKDKPSSLKDKDKPLPEPPTKDDKKQKKSGKDEKKELMERMQPPKGTRPTDMAQGKGERWERDPVTGLDVLIREPKFEDFRDKGIDNSALDPSDPKSGPSLHPPDPKTQDARYPAPAPASPGNILLQQFPPPTSPVDVSHLKAILRTGAVVVCALCALAWFSIRGGSWVQFFWKSTVLGAIAGVAWIAAENAGRKVEKEVERVRMNMQKQRGEEFSPPTPESVEWLNALLKVVWGLLNPDMFVPYADMVEDILQQSLPSFIDAVRIADVGQGTNPVRVVSMRALPDQPGDPEYPREEWVGLGQGGDEDSKAQAATIGGDSGGGPDTDQTGDYVNYEVALSYQALPGQRSKLRFHNIHLMLEFFLGVWDWFRIPVPIYAIVEGFVATVRMRVQFVQSPPFVRNLTVTLMGVPKVEVSVEPFTKKLPNVLDLPMVQKFVEAGLAAACAQYVAPKSLTLNLGELLSGVGALDTHALGVLIITIHHASSLSAQDRNGKSDPYIVLAYAKFGKPLYSTRIILGDVNPVWEETAFLLVSEDEVKGEEDLSAMLWDSDRRSADDLVGRVNVPVTELMKRPNKMFRREDKLMGFEDANDMPGTLVWEIGYYEKVPLLKKQPTSTTPALGSEASGSQTAVGSGSTDSNMNTAVPGDADAKQWLDKPWAIASPEPVALTERESVASRERESVVSTEREPLGKPVASPEPLERTGGSLEPMPKPLDQPIASPASDSGGTHTPNVIGAMPPAATDRAMPPATTDPAMPPATTDPAMPPATTDPALSLAHVVAARDGSERPVASEPVGVEKSESQSQQAHDEKQPQKYESRSQQPHDEKPGEKKEKRIADPSQPVKQQPKEEQPQEEADALHRPPDPEIPTGILSVVIHQINNLERQDIKGTTGNREGQSGQDTSEPAQEGPNLPNSYCEIIINDDMIYKTRVKQYTSMPYFEAGAERFVRDWRNAVVRVQVRDARLREKDPVLGIVTVRLAEVFKKSCEVTRLFSLQEGIGYGRANISFMFRQVKTDLPPTAFGWETGTLEIPSGIRVEPTPEFSREFSTKKLHICTTDQTYNVPTSAARSEGGSVYWDIPQVMGEDSKVRMPVYNRYSSAVVFEIGAGGKLGLGSGPDYMAIYWFKDMGDDEETEIRVPVLKSKNLKQLRQNYINDETAKTHKYDIVGWLTCTLVMDHGLDPDHEDFQRSRDDKHRYEAYDRVEGQARVAERSQQLQSKGDLTKKEQKEINDAKAHQLALRHRGVMQYKAARTAKWSKEGLRKRASTLKGKITGGSTSNRDRNPVASEA